MLNSGEPTQYQKIINMLSILERIIVYYDNYVKQPLFANIIALQLLDDVPTQANKLQPFLVDAIGKLDRHNNKFLNIVRKINLDDLFEVYETEVQFIEAYTTKGKSSDRYQDPIEMFTHNMADSLKVRHKIEKKLNSSNLSEEDRKEELAKTDELKLHMQQTQQNKLQVYIHIIKKKLNQITFFPLIVLFSLKGVANASESLTDDKLNEAIFDMCEEFTKKFINPIYTAIEKFENTDSQESQIAAYKEIKVPILKLIAGIQETYKVIERMCDDSLKETSTNNSGVAELGHFKEKSSNELDEVTSTSVNSSDVRDKPTASRYHGR